MNILLHRRKYIFILGLLFFPFVALNSQYSYSKGDTALIKDYLTRYEKFEDTTVRDRDSALYYINKSLLLSQELGYDHYLVPIYKEYVKLMEQIGNYSMSLDFSYKIMEELDNKSKKTPDSIELKKEYASLYISLGFTYYYLDDREKSLDYFYRGLDMSETIYQQDKTYDLIGAKAIIYNNIGSIHLANDNFGTARANFLKALELNAQIKDEIREARIYNNLGIISRELSENNKAFEYYTKAIEISTRLNDMQGLAQTYNNLANYYHSINNPLKSIELLNKSIEISRETANLRSEKISTSILSSIYFSMGDYKNAFLTSRKEIALNENLLSQESAKQISQIEYRYNYEKLIKEEKHEQELLLAQKEKNILISIMVIGILVLVCLILLLFYRNVRIKVRQQKLQSQNLELEKQNLELLNSELGKDIENKNKELTTYVMYLSQKNSFISTIIQELSECNNDPKLLNKQKINSIVRQMKANIDNTSWEEFEIRFQKVHQDFYSKLIEKVPNLTPNEKRLCAFLRLNMTTKEIASITFQSIKSIQVARTRLRKKMDIERDDNLIAVLQEL